jgi:predicted NAD-dependent protein-ADP-ribosyltransferase YbiA (DUF1768 family)
LISNFATAPFELDAQAYTSVESFWQGLKFTHASDRRRLARLAGAEAQKEDEKQGDSRTIEYGGKEIPGWNLGSLATDGESVQREI